MEDQKDITTKPLAGEDDVASTDGDKAVDNIESKESIKDILGEELGKDFKTDEAALKAVKDTFSYVGKKKEDIKDEVKQEAPTDDFVSRKEFEEATFYAKHPEYEPYKGIIGALKNATENTLDEVVKADDFKAVYEKATAHDESEKSKSVLQTNPRLGKVTDKMTQAKEAAAKGDTTAAKDLAVAAVIEAYEN